MMKKRRILIAGTIMIITASMLAACSDVQAGTSTEETLTEEASSEEIIHAVVAGTPTYAPFTYADSD